MEKNLEKILVDPAPDKQPETKKAVKGWRKVMRIVGNVAFGLVLLAIAVMAFFMIRSKVTGTPPTVFGNYIFIVLSGSMEPTFSTGSVVFVKPAAPDKLAVGDVVTFTGFAGSSQLTTHRIISISKDDNYGLLLTTKGDANDAQDPDPIPAANVIGTVSGHLPLAGYLMSFVQTRQGLTVFILVPAALLITYEVYSFLKNRDKKKKAPELVEVAEHGEGSEGPQT